MHICKTGNPTVKYICQVSRGQYLLRKTGNNTGNYLTPEPSHVDEDFPNKQAIVVSPDHRLKYMQISGNSKTGNMLSYMQGR